MELVIKDLTKKFDGKAVIDQANFTFEKGKIYGLLGRNGAGKTTLFNCISKDMSIDSGELYLNIDDKLEDYADTKVGLVQAVPNIPDFMTGYEFIKFFIDMNADNMTHTMEPSYYLEEIGIKKQDHHRLLKDYSHGMKNKVQMIATIMIQPPILLLDEPLTSFDVVAAHDIKELILSIKKDSIVIFSTHILQLAQDLCDEIVMLHEGSLTGYDAQKIHSKDFEAQIIARLSSEEGKPVSGPSSVEVGGEEDV